MELGEFFGGEVAKLAALPGVHLLIAGHAVGSEEGFHEGGLLFAEVAERGQGFWVHEYIAGAFPEGLLLLAGEEFFAAGRKLLVYLRGDDGADHRGGKSGGLEAGDEGVEVARLELVPGLGE